MPSTCLGSFHDASLSMLRRRAYFRPPLVKRAHDGKWGFAAAAPRLTQVKPKHQERPEPNKIPS